MSYKVSIEGSPSFSVNEGDTVLSAALRADIGFPYDCSSGGCGNCRFELITGEVTELWPDAPGLSLRERKKNKLLACQCHPQTDLAIKVRTDDEYRPVIAPVRLEGVVVETLDVTHDMRQVTIRTEGAAVFRPGQYAMLGFEGLKRPRAYSMSNLPNDDGVWQFIIRRVPDGTFSNHLFDHMEVGSRLMLDGPYGTAWLRSESPRDVLCISGGSGLAPMLSIVRGAAALGTQRKLNFYFGARTPSDVFSLGQFDVFSRQESPVNTRFVVSNPDDSWCGESGFVHASVEKDLGGRLSDFEIYLAGPPPMVDAVQEMLFLRHKVPIQQVHLDRFF